VSHAPSPGADDVASLVAEAARPFAPLWPLRSFVAVDPLVDLGAQGFADALADATRWLPLRFDALGEVLAAAWREGRLEASDLETSLEALSEIPPPAERREPVSLCASEEVLAGIDREVAKFAAAFLGGVLDRREGTTLFAAWRAVVGRDPGAKRLLGSEGRRRLAESSPDPARALLDALWRLEIHQGDRVRFLTAHLARLPGWAGFAKWCSTWSPKVSLGPRIDLVELAALRACYVATATDLGRDGTPHAWAGTGALAPLPALPGLPEHLRVALSRLPAPLALEAVLGALERAAARRLLAKVQPFPRPAPAGTAPAAQVLCCIDARETRLRDGLEATGRYQTEGVAGFFGVPLDVQATPVGGARSLRPPLLSPAATLSTDGAPAPGPARRLATEGKAAANASIGAGFALVEGAGVVAALRLARLLGRPGGFGRARRQRVLPGSRAERWPADECWPADERWPEIDDDVAASLLASLLAPTGVGQARPAAPLVVLLGHFGSSTNNLYGSSLHCGACGAEPGGTNAVAAARLANRPGVRSRLAHAGFVLDQRTWFVAAEHDTATGRVTLLDTASVPASHRQALATLAADLDRAAQAALERAAPALPGSRDARAKGRSLADAAAARAFDPAELQPELGLAGAIALFVGPRRLTLGHDLEGRVFLHSYEPELDRDGSVLAAILSGPLVVAQWIAAQYLGALLFPGAFGGADKAALNPVADQVALPAGSLDPTPGLPRQSVRSATGLLHEPLRLLAVVAASAEGVDRSLEQAPAAAGLVQGRYVRLVALDPDRAGWVERRPAGGWRAVPELAQREAGPSERSGRGTGSSLPGRAVTAVWRERPAGRWDLWRRWSGAARRSPSA